MIDLTFQAQIAAALKGARHVMILAPRARMLEQPWRGILKGPWTSSLSRIVEATPAGDMGKAVTTWPAGKDVPELVTLGILPDAVSRHLSPSRSHAITEVARKADLTSRGKAAVILVLDEPEHYLAAALALGRALPSTTRKTGKKKPALVAVVAIDARGHVIEPVPHVQVAVGSARWAGAMVDRPTADLDTAMFVEEALQHVRGLRGVKSRVIVGDDLRAQGLGGIHAVGRAATVAPRMLILEHEPKGARGTVALVGKGIVYDTGGLALKTRDGMFGMKGDMGGGAAVVGAFRTLVADGCPHRLACLVPLAENAIGPNSYRNDEILTLHSGKTVEINNTDAEGRLLLADACSYAAQTWKPGVLIDAATLTGAQLVATGRLHAGIVSNRAGLEQLAVDSGLRSGDICHPMPFAPELYQREFKSTLADMRNSVKNRDNAQASCAAQFVWAHVNDPRIAWLHVDLAGPAHVEDHGTGYGVGLLSEVVRGLGEVDLRI